MDAIVLGSAQDAGVPQMLCRCNHCLAAASDPGMRRAASSVAIIDDDEVLLLDASPDIRHQWMLLPVEARLAGVALTHAHAGHIAGLAMLGKEGPQAACNLLATPRMHAYLQTNPAFRDATTHMQMVQVPAGEGTLRPFDVRFHPIKHRAERADTVAIEVRGPSHRFMYMPDTDALDGHVHDAWSHLEAGDALLFDATFWSAQEVGHRDVTAIPHPFVQASLADLRRLADRGVNVMLGHLNHTNPLCDPASPAYEEILDAGLSVAHDGMRVSL